jgi:hypothetical protein
MPGESDFFLKGIELISQSDRLQRVAFIASDDDPGDIIVLTPGADYESELGKLSLLAGGPLTKSGCPIHDSLIVMSGGSQLETLNSTLDTTPIIKSRSKKSQRRA